jgi:hypothetical protein
MGRKRSKLGLVEMALANQILENSFPNSAPPRLRLVHLDEINYTEDDDEEINLTWLTLNSDVNSLRDQFGADLVSMYISKSRPVAWMLRQNPSSYRSEGTFSTVIPGTVGALFPNPPAGTTIYKWDEQNNQYIVNNFTFGQWSIPGMSMNPGEGVIIENPGAAFVVNLVGEVKQGNLSNSVPDGFAIRSSLLPVGGGVVSSLGFPMANDERIHRMTNTNGSYTIYYHFGTSPSGFWSPNPPGEPAPSTGEAFWSEKHNSQDWIRNFWIWQ